MDKFSVFADTIIQQKYAHDLDGGKETWSQIAYRVASSVLKTVKAPKSQITETAKLIEDRIFIPGGRYLYASGRPFHQTQNCLLFRADDSREGWAELLHKQTLGLMTGAGTGTVYSDVRAEGKAIRGTGGTSTGPIALMQMVNEAGRGIMQGGSRRAAIWAGLHWWHPDAHKFIHLKDWSLEVRALKLKDFNFPATMDMTNISIILDDEFFKAYNNEKHPKHALAYSVYWDAVRQMRKTGEPGFSIDTGVNNKENLRNACCEITSEDDSDICNLGSINLARIESVEQMKRVTELATAFLLAGTIYSHVPFAKVDQIRSKNRRLGLGLMGIHEWLLKRGKKYRPDADLAKILDVYATSGDYADKYADEWEISRPLKTRAIAPTGSIGIAAETTTGCEPIFCVAIKRRYLKHFTWNYQYIIDPTAQRLVDAGVDPDTIEDAYSIDEERRIEFQAWLQYYVDHAISSTINLPSWGSESNNDSNVHDFGIMLLKYLPYLRGLTCYPDGARGGQPLSPVKFSTAIKHIGKVFEESGTDKPTITETVVTQAPQLNAGLEMNDAEAAMPIDVCDITKGGQCGA
jgi:ribonucleoside-diphosphate reductase alpha chain